MKGAHLVVQALIEQEVKYVFGISGDSTLPILDVLYDHADAVKYMTIRHEQVGTAMADGYGRVTNTPGVVLNHVGPGTCNMVLPLASALKDSTPLVALTGVQDQAKLGRDAWHEIDQLAVFKPVTKWNARVYRPDQITRTIREAFVRAQSGRMGPVHVDIPKDVSKQPLDEASWPVETTRVPSVRAANRILPNPVLVEAALDLLLAAARPVILAGGGVNRSDASAALVDFAELIGAPVITTGMGRGAIPEDHPLAVGACGHFGTATGNQLLKQADLVLGVGTRFSDVTTFDWTGIAPNAQILHVDIDPGEIGRQYVPAVGMVADAREALLALAAAARQRQTGAADRTALLAEYRARRDAEREQTFSIADDAVVKPQQITALLTRLLDRNAIVAVGSGVHAQFAKRVPVFESGHWLKSIGLGSMGWAFPAAMGAKLARPNNQVVAMVGDGDFSMVMQDLETAVRERINVVVIIFNDNAYGALKQFQKTQYEERYIGSDLKNVPYDQFARLVGAQGWRVDKPSELGPALEQALRAGGPAVVDVMVDPFEFPANRQQAEAFVFSGQSR